MSAGSDAFGQPGEERHLQRVDARVPDLEMLQEEGERRRVEEAPAEEEEPWACSPAWWENQDPECLEVGMCVLIATIGGTLLLLLHLGMTDPRYPTKR